jgi:predicted Zn-dependent protease
MLAQIRSRFFLVVTLIFTLQLMGCATPTTQKGAVGVQRQQLLIVSEKEMEQAAEKSYKQILAKAKKEGKLNPDPQMTARVRAIAKRLIPQTAVFRKDAPNWKWEINVIDSPELNAWCMPGGKIVVYSGIIKKLQLTDDELAAIMGHEIAHALREHGRERASEAMLKQVGLQALALGTGVKGPYLDLANTVADLTFTLPFSRLHEQEADRIGVELAARAGYNPYAAVKVWEKMSKLSKDAPPEILSTHPSNDSRMKDLKKMAKVVYPLYLQALKEMGKQPPEPLQPPPAA